MKAVLNCVLVASFSLSLCDCTCPHELAQNRNHPEVPLRATIHLLASTNWQERAGVYFDIQQRASDGMRASEEDLDLLGIGLNDCHVGVRHVAAETVKIIGPPAQRLAPLLFRCLQAEDESSGMMMQALLRMGDRVSVPYFRDLVHSDNVRFKRWGVWGLQETHADRPAVLKLLKTELEERQGHHVASEADLIEDLKTAIGNIEKGH